MARRDLSGLSDDELVALARRGRAPAYAELWLRHVAAAHAVARSFTNLDSDDVVAEAFTRVLARIRAGGGPTMGFRAYLLTTVKNVAREWGPVEARTDAADLAEVADADTGDASWSVEAALEAGTTVSAFRSLPSRWQEALWYSEVEGLKPRQFAPILGLAANAASALTVRARRGFRDAWVQAQLRAAETDECRSVLGMLGAHTRGALSTRDARIADAHLATCERCALAWAEAQQVSSHLALALLPVVVGVPAAASYAAWLQTGPATGTVLAAGAGSSVASGGAAPGAPGGSRLSRPAQIAAVAAAAVAAVAIGAGVWAAVGSSPTPTDAAPPAAQQPAAPQDAEPAPPAPAPAADPASDPAATPDPSPSTPAPPRPRPVDPGRVSPAPAPGPDPASHPTPTPTPTPHPSPSPTPTPTPPLTPPTMTVDTGAGPLVYPELSGTDAEPGATVEIVDETDTVRASTVADAAGAWSVSDLSASACATTASAYLPAGTHSLSARQRVGERTSPLSAAATVTVAAPPVFVSPAEGEVVSRAGFTLAITGEPLASVQRIKLPDPSPCRPTPMVLDAAGDYSSVFTLSEADTTVTIGVRYLDPATGRHGAAAFVTFSAG